MAAFRGAGQGLAIPGNILEYYPDLTIVLCLIVYRDSDFSDSYSGVYDFSARYNNLLYGRWFAHDPAKQGINPYVYCGNNPVMMVDPDGRRWRTPQTRDWIINAIRKKIDQLEDVNLRLQTKIEKREILGKNTRRIDNRIIDNESRIAELKGSIDAVNILESDARIYDLKGPSEPDIHKVRLGDDGIIYIEGSNTALYIHEIEHVKQSIEAGGLRFLDGELLNEGKTLMPNEEYGTCYMEVNAYKKQYAYDPQSLPFTVYSGIHEITISKVLGIINPNTHRYVYGNLSK